MGLNLMETMGEIFNEGFDVENSPISDFEDIPDGVYDVVVENFKLQKSENTGTEWFSFWFQITTGEYQGKKYFGNLWLSKKAVKGSLKKLAKYAYFMGVDLEKEDFADTDIIIEKMQDTLGVQSTLTLKTTGKGDKSFTNWELSF